MTTPLSSRRIVFQGLTALGVAAALAGCGGGDEADPAAEGGSPTESSPEPSETPPSETPPSRKEPRKTRPQAKPLATTSEVPVGGGIVLTAERIVITQPERGDFRAFSAVCTHQGQTVGDVADNTITCNFHGSQYDAATGQVTNGPAPAGLDAVRIRVRQGQIIRA